MASAAQSDKSKNNHQSRSGNGDGRRNNGGNRSKKAGSRSANNLPKRDNDGQFRKSNGAAPWLTALSIGVAVAAGLFATRKQWMHKDDEWNEDFSAAFADDETDYENFDQTRNAGTDSMRDHPGDDWEDIDDMSDASFPASDPPSFTPAKA